MEKIPFIPLFVIALIQVSCGSSKSVGPEVPAAYGGGAAESDAVPTPVSGDSAPEALPKTTPIVSSEGKTDSILVVQPSEQPATPTKDPGSDSEIKPVPESVIPPDPVPVPATETPTAPPPLPVCSPGKTQITVIKLLTGSISLALSKQSLFYEVSILNCLDGKIVPIKDQHLAYTLNMNIAVRGPINFEVYNYNDAASLKKGVMSALDGDIFGPQPGYYHWESADLNLPSAVDRLIFEVKFINPFESTTKTETLSYIRINDAEVNNVTVGVGK